jgi:hypothetical protein
MATRRKQPHRHEKAAAATVSASAFHGAPDGVLPVGYSRLVAQFGLKVLSLPRLSFLTPKGGRREHNESGRRVVIFPAAYAPGETVTDHLEFALKHEGLNLEVLAALFLRSGRRALETELTRFVRERPTGRYARQMWFLYEFLTGRQLPLKDVPMGNYVELLEPTAYYTAPGIRSRRHRVINNLLGTAEFCPTVRRTPVLAKFEARDLASVAVRIVEEFNEDTIRRAVSYLYTKETRSSFDIEGEKPSSSKTERYVAILRAVPGIEKITREELVRIQNETVDSRFADKDYRSDQVYVGEQLDLRRQKIHYIAPKPDDVRSMMNGLLAGIDRLHAPEIEPVVAAAVASFGFVFIHPFSDGNGRIHRLLIHYMLSRAGFTPNGLIFPVSAVMLARRAEYDNCLEIFSAPLMRLLDYEEDDEGVVTVQGETAVYYRYFDATPMAEALYGWVERTIQEEFRSELEFVLRFREARRAIEEVVELPDRAANLFIKLCLSNGGKLSAARRKTHFSKLTEKETRGMERAVNAHMGRLVRSTP